MDQATALVILRHVLTAAGAVLVTKGVLNDGELQIIIGALVGVAPTIWGIVQKFQQKAAVVTAAATGVPTQASAVSPLHASQVDTAIANAAPPLQATLKGTP